MVRGAVVGWLVVADGRVYGFGGEGEGRGAEGGGKQRTPSEGAWRGGGVSSVRLEHEEQLLLCGVLAQELHHALGGTRLMFSKGTQKYRKPLKTKNK